MIEDDRTAIAAENPADLFPDGGLNAADLSNVYLSPGSDLIIRPRPYFPEPEWEEFKKDDIKAGTAIILEMAGIFSIGLMLYAVIAFIVGKS